MAEEIEEKLNKLLDAHEAQRQKIDDLLNAEEPKPTFTDKMKAAAFPLLCIINGLFFMGLYNKIGQIDQISTKVDILMKQANLSYNAPQIKQWDNHRDNSQPNKEFYAEAEHSKTILITDESNYIKN